MDKLKPKLFSVLKNYNKKQFSKDAISGIIVAIVALPLSIAFAIASGLSPEKGIYTAIIAGLLISFLGGSRVQIGGPSSIFMVIVLGLVLEYGYEGLITVTFIAGIILIIFGFLKLGSVIKYIPYPITMGFTSGIAVIMFASQIKDFLGLSYSEISINFIDRMLLNFNYIKTFNIYAILIGFLTILCMRYIPKLSKKVPGSLVAIVIFSIITAVFDLPVKTIGSTFGDFSNVSFEFNIPKINIETISLYIEPAIIVAILAGIESLMSAVVSDGMIGSKHRSNMELIAVGTANIACSIFGGMPATGATSRTITNVKNGARTPISGMIHALTLLIMLIFLMPLASKIPLAALSGIIIVVAYNMFQIKELRIMFKSPKEDVFVLIITLLLTVFVNLITAIEVGLVLAMFLFMKRMSDQANVNMKSLDASEDQDITFDFDKANKQFQTNKDILIYEINGPFFFGAADKFIDYSQKINEKNKLIIIGLKHVSIMDATALHGFRRLVNTCVKLNINLYVTGVNIQPFEVMNRAGLVEIIGNNHFYKTIEEAKEAYKKNSSK